MKPMIAAATIENTQYLTCGICGKQISIYKCPKCNLQYCSLACYKSEEHADCTESFYKDSFMTELHGKKVEDSEKKRMMDILKRFEQENVDSSFDQVLSLAERLANVDLNRANPQEILKLLTQSEIDEFERIFKSQDASNIISIWKPWWMQPVQKITPLDSNYNSTNIIPEILPNISPLENLTRRIPKDSVLLNVVDIIFAFVQASRYFNGDWSEDSRAVCTVIWKTSQILGSTSTEPVIFQSTEEIISSIRAHSLKQEPRERQPSLEAFKIFLNDVCLILSTPVYTVAALSEMFRLLDAVNESFSARMRRHAFLSAKKVYFYLAWTNKNFLVQEGLSRIARALSKCVEELEVELTQMKGSDAYFEKLRQQLKSNHSSISPIIEVGAHV